jgi:hypothetical protein
MKKVLFILLVAISLFTISCGNNSDKKNDESDSTGNKSNNSQNVEIKENCKYSVDMFNSFLGLKMGSTYDDIVKLYGKPSSESVDGDYITCEWSTGTRYPLIVYIDNDSKKITEFYLEILGIGENLYPDIKDAISKYKLSECYSSFFGISQKDLEAKIGKPSEVRREEKNDDADYYSKDDTFMVTFGFWKEQQMKCTSINVLWE